jgi:hypothetical protein
MPQPALLSTVNPRQQVPLLEAMNELGHNKEKAHHMVSQALD